MAIDNPQLPRGHDRENWEREALADAPDPARDHQAAKVQAVDLQEQALPLSNRCSAVFC